MAPSKSFDAPKSEDTEGSILLMSGLLKMERIQYEVITRVFRQCLSQCVSMGTEESKS